MLEFLGGAYPKQRAAEHGQPSPGEMLRWAARYSHEVSLVDGEFCFITVLSADSDEGIGH